MRQQNDNNPSRISLRLGYKIHLRLIKGDYGLETLRSSLAALSTAIHAAGQKADNAEHDDIPSELRNIVIDEQTEIIESLLGAAFLVCQTRITAFTSYVKALHKFHSSQCPNEPLKLDLDDKSKVMALGGRFKIGQPPYNEIQLLNAAANYVKHHTEWGPRWENATSRRSVSKATADAVAAVGLEPGSTGNLRRMSEMLNNAEYYELNTFANLIETWQRDVQALIENALRDIGVLT